MLLELIQYSHLINDILSGLYIFFFYINKKYDFYYLLYFILIFIHWIGLKNECIISYFEKKLIDPTYKFGSNPCYHPYRDLITKEILYFLDILKIFTFFYILYRNLDNGYIISEFLILFSLCLNLYNNNNNSYLKIDNLIKNIKDYCLNKLKKK